MPTSPPAEGLLNCQEAAEYLGIQVSTLRAWTFQRRIPSVKISRRCVRYRASDLAKFAERHVKPALRQPAAR